MEEQILQRLDPNSSTTVMVRHMQMEVTLKDYPFSTLLVIFHVQTEFHKALVHQRRNWVLSHLQTTISKLELP